MVEIIVNVLYVVSINLVKVNIDTTRCIDMIRLKNPITEQRSIIEGIRMSGLVWSLQNSRDIRKTGKSKDNLTSRQVCYQC